MPLYDYKCRKCGEKFETYKTFLVSDKTIKCPKCGTEDPERQLGSFTYKGAGGGCASPTSRFT